MNLFMALWLGKMNQKTNATTQGVRNAASQGVMNAASQGVNGQGDHGKCIITHLVNLTNFVNM
jgi:hypothetical protein